MKKKSIWTIAAIVAIAGMLITAILSGQSKASEYSDDNLSIPMQNMRYGFNTDSFDIDYFTLEPNQFLGDILSARGIDYTQIDAVSRAAEEVYSVRRLRSGKQCALIRRKGSGYVDCFIYEPNPYEYVRFHLHGEPCVDVIERQTEHCIETSSGIIDHSLWVAMEEIGHHHELIAKMEDALAWAVSFYDVQKGDEFRLVYEHIYIDGEPVGIGKLLGASFTTLGKTSHAVYFESDTYQGYFDLEGRPMKRAFLKAPVRFSRISSRYSHRRFHPVLKRYKGHFGTDYAAPTGTPIMAVANGTIIKASYTGGNGNYVKIRHDETYETQYLHMSRFARGIKPGVRVSQGDVIGYVGSTGLATGPHVCFRFWKNGRQVDHLRENLPPPEPMPAKDLPRYMTVKDEMLVQLNAIDISPFPEQAIEAEP